ncbi:MAG: hypothetical protein FVQ80_06680 [Planctomycetes bacterium]|nr:hypothetical protein [Planctomycetota bacterium]
MRTMDSDELELERKLRRVNKLRATLEERREKKLVATGKQENVLERLRREYKCKSIEASKSRCKNIDERVALRNRRIDKIFSELEEEYDL